MCFIGMKDVQEQTSHFRTSFPNASPIFLQDCPKEHLLRVLFSVLTGLYEITCPV